ncbi:retrotransposon protein, putative, ty1-copia subclass [Tanacetum coccineum]
MSVSEGETVNFIDMVRSMMNLTTLPLSFWDYALESATRILNMVPTKKVDKTPYELKYASFKDPFMVLSKHQEAGIKDLMRKSKVGFTQNLDEPCVYQKASGRNVTFLILYVDDIIIMGNHIPSLQSVKDYLGKCFAMKDLGEAAFILGIKIYRDRSKRLIDLSKCFMIKILKRL